MDTAEVKEEVADELPPFGQRQRGASTAGKRTEVAPSPQAAVIEIAPVPRAARRPASQD